MNAKQVQAEHTDFVKHFGVLVETAAKFKKVMIDKGLAAAKTECPKCKTAGALQGRLIVGPAAGRHRRSGGAFRMWCESCTDVAMME